MRYLAEFGVVFLMFVIGLEFNLPKLRACARSCSGWASQVVLTILGAMAGNLALVWLLAAAAATGGSAGRARSRSAARWRCRTALVVKLMADGSSSRASTAAA